MPAAAAAVGHLAVGTAAPDFTLKDQNNQDVRLSAVNAGGPVLIVFYPFAFTRICTGELNAVQHDPSFSAGGLTALSISCDSPFANKIFAEREGFDFPMLSDFWPHGVVASRYGVLNQVGGHPDRGTFLVDAGGTIRFAELFGRGHGRDPQVWRDAIAAL